MIWSELGRLNQKYVNILKVKSSLPKNYLSQGKKYLVKRLLKYWVTSDRMILKFMSSGREKYKVIDISNIVQISNIIPK